MYSLWTRTECIPLWNKTRSEQIRLGRFQKHWQVFRVVNFFFTACAFWTIIFMFYVLIVRKVCDVVLRLIVSYTKTITACYLVNYLKNGPMRTLFLELIQMYYLRTKNILIRHLSRSLIWFIQRWKMIQFNFFCLTLLAFITSSRLIRFFRLIASRLWS